MESRRGAGGGSLPHIKSERDPKGESEQTFDFDNIHRSYLADSKMSNPVDPESEIDLKRKSDTGLEMIDTSDNVRSRSNISDGDERGVSVVGGGPEYLFLCLCLCLCLRLCLCLCLCLSLMIKSVLSVWSQYLSACHYQSEMNCSTADPVLNCCKFGF